MEMKTNVGDIPYTVAHELIHYQQTSPEETTLLERSILEGSASFLGELISGKHSDDEVFEYGDTHTAELCNEFVKVIHNYEYQGWLYGGGLKAGRVRDLGYWMGYQITEVLAMLNDNSFSPFSSDSRVLSGAISVNLKE